MLKHFSISATILLFTACFPSDLPPIDTMSGPGTETGDSTGGPSDTDGVTSTTNPGHPATSSGNPDMTTDVPTTTDPSEESSTGVGTTTMEDATTTTGESTSSSGTGTETEGETQTVGFDCFPLEDIVSDPETLDIKCEKHPWERAPECDPEPEMPSCQELLKELSLKGCDLDICDYISCAEALAQAPCGVRPPQCDEITQCLSLIPG